MTTDRTQLSSVASKVTFSESGVISRLCKRQCKSFCSVLSVKTVLPYCVFVYDSKLYDLVSGQIEVGSISTLLRKSFSHWGEIGER